MYTWKEIVDHIIHHLKREAHEARRGVTEFHVEVMVDLIKDDWGSTPMSAKEALQWEEVERKVRANFGLPF